MGCAQVLHELFRHSGFCESEGGDVQWINAVLFGEFGHLSLFSFKPSQIVFFLFQVVHNESVVNTLVRAHRAGGRFLSVPIRGD